ARAELVNQTSFLINAHQSLPATLYLQTRYEHYDQSLAANRLGSFSFASLSDLAGNRPSSFARTLNTPDRSGGELFGAAAAGASWSSRKIALTGGLRLDANVFTGAPTYNAALDRTLGVRNDEAPGSVALSPRFGFYWYYKTPAGLSINNTGFSTLFRGGPQIRGGIGRFRGDLRSDL